MGDKVTEMSGRAFANCENLEEVVLSSSLIQMDFGAFIFCDKLDTVVIPASVKTVTANWTPAYASHENFDIHKDFYFCGDAPDLNFLDGEILSIGIVDGYATNIRTDFYYPVGAAGWSDLIRRFENREDIRFYPYDPDSDGQMHGTVTAIPTYAASGETVTLRVVPDRGYKLALLEVTDNEGSRRIPVLGRDESTYTFSMPACDVTVHAKFTKI